LKRRKKKYFATTEQMRRFPREISIIYNLSMFVSLLCFASKWTKDEKFPFFLAFDELRKLLETCLHHPLRSQLEW
jgi:hypothetical protein